MCGYPDSDTAILPTMTLTTVTTASILFRISDFPVDWSSYDCTGTMFTNQCVTSAA